MKANGFDLTTGSMDLGVKVSATVAGESEPVVVAKAYTDNKPDPTVSIDFGGLKTVKALRLEVTNLRGGDGHIHIRELKFKP
jgi:hypothetical protein